MTRDTIKNTISYFLIAIALVLFAIAVYIIFGWIAEFNHTEAKADCNAYYKVESGQPDAQSNLNRCLDDAQNTRRTTNRIGGLAAGALTILALGVALWEIKAAMPALPHRVQLL